MVRRPETPEQIASDMHREFAGHICHENPVRSFTFNSYWADKKAALREVERKGERIATFKAEESARYQPSPTMGFQLTWTPGNLALTGDLGELTLSNHSCGTFAGAISWAQSPDHSYLMSKSDKREQEFDCDATAREIVQMANEPVLDYFAGHRLWNDAKKRLDRKVGIGSFRSEMRATRADRHLIGPHDWGGFDREEWDVHHPRRFTPRNFALGVHPRHERDRWEYDEMWLTWVRIHEKVGGWEPISEVTRPGHRKHLARELPDYLGSAHEAADFCSEIGLDDYYGSYRWPWRSYAQIEAIRWGCRMIKEREFPQETRQAAE